MAIYHSTLPIKINLDRPSTSSRRRRLPTAALAQSQPYWAAIEADVDAYLKKSITIRPPEAVFEPMRHLAFAAPRTSASSLCVAACELVGGDRGRAMAAAAAIHLMHAAAHAHEHLPLTDGPGPGPKPEVPHEYGPNIELLTADGLIPLAFELLTRPAGPARPEYPDRILRVVVEISRAAGSEGILDGLHKQGEILEPCSRFEFVEYVCRKKYGVMHACAAASGAILGGAAEEEIQKLRNFGMHAGTMGGLVEKKNSCEIENMIRKLKDLALKELEGFNGNNVELISSLVAEVEPGAEAEALRGLELELYID